MHVHCVPVPVWFSSVIRHPSSSCVLSPAWCSTAGRLELRNRGVPTIITSSHVITVKGRCYRHNNTKYSQPKDLKKCLCMSLFWNFSAGVNAESFILKINWVLCCWFGVWLPVSSVMNLLCCPAFGRSRSPAYLLQQCPDCHLASDTDVSIAGPPTWDFLTNIPQ